MKIFSFWRGGLALIILGFMVVHYNFEKILPLGGYDYSLGEAKSIPVSISRGQFMWPAETQSYDTIFLKTDLRSNLLGALFQPFVKVECKGDQFIQSFERGVKGIRYLNLSPCVSKLKPGDKILLSSPFLFLSDKASNGLELFQNQSPDEQSILVVAPHPDDAEMAAFGLYAFHNSTIVTVTLGEEGKQKYKQLFSSRSESYLVKGQLRFWDSITVPFYGDIPPERSVNLGYFDGTLEGMYSNPQQKVTSTETGITDLQVFRKHNLSDLAPADVQDATWPNLVNDFVTILGRVHPAIIVMPHPILDTHPDHRYSTLAVLEALKQAGSGKEIIYFYSNHHVHAEDWPMGPPEAIVTLPPWHDNQFLFDRIYSHAMSDHVYEMKFFALDGMHSLRPSFFRNFNGVLGWIGMTGKAFEFGYRRAKIFRKSWHPNELFFVVDSDHVQKLNLESLDFRRKVK
ncbi:MAG: PIG-L family deacetylase [Candidatus Omnitrophica bacterium]|nr:PIG-L family deacetylase [Candidatus Omnitrophota bacterium]